MSNTDHLDVCIEPYDERTGEAEFDLDRVIFDLDTEITSLTSQGDKLDYLISIASGIICGALDILWVGEFNLERGRDIASEETKSLVTRLSKAFGYEGDNLQGAVRYLERKFPIPSDGNTAQFGGGAQHHLHDFAHHPNLIGLVFSLLTQFTGRSYGTDSNGACMVVDVPERSRVFIGDTVPAKIMNGTIIWFFHLVSDVAGSSSSVATSGGTGIPGPLLSLAKQVSAIPLFRSVTANQKSISDFLMRLFNGRLTEKRDATGAVIKGSGYKLDLRGELGIRIETSRQAIPVVANESMVRTFYFLRRLAVEVQEQGIQSITDFWRMDWQKVKPSDNPTIARMLTIATAVFTTVDVSEAVISQKFLVSINYAGVGRFSVAIQEDVAWTLKRRDIKVIKLMYQTIQMNTYAETDEKLYRRMGNDMDMDKLGLTIEQTEILYNLEYYKTLNDIEATKIPLKADEIKNLKQSWLSEWQTYMTSGFSSFIQVEGADLNWYSQQELTERIQQNNPQDYWFRLVLLEAMLFEPYYPLSVEKDKKGEDIPSRKYDSLKLPLVGYQKSIGDNFLDAFYTMTYFRSGYIKRLRTCYDKVALEMKEVLKGILIGGAVTAGVALVTIATAGALAPGIAVWLVGSNFAGLSGAALTSASLAYLGGGAVAVGGMGMAGGTIAIVGGGTILGLGAGLGIGGAVGSASLLNKQNTIAQSAKLLVAVREIFLNDEHDLEYSDSIYEQYVENIMEIEKSLVDLRFQADVASGEEKKELKKRIKNAEDSVEAMKIARKNMLKFKSSFEEGLQ